MSTRRVIAVGSDLFFATRISATAAQVGVEVLQPAIAEAHAAVRLELPDLVILDLMSAGDPLALARALKSDPATGHVPLVGFYPHVEQTLREAALAAGVDRVLPRSAFIASLARLLQAGLSPRDPDC